jgi:DNA-binding transcriptional LysR family regulator
MRQILAIHHHGSFAKAAEALGMAQPSLSKSIARVEDQLKIRIFDRTSKGSELTPIGEVIIERAAKIIAETEDLVRDTALIAGGETGTLRIGAGISSPQRFLSDLVTEVAEHFPRLRLHMEIGHWAPLIAALGRRELDIVFCALNPQVEDPRFTVTDVLNCRGVAVASPDHPLAGLDHVSAEAFAQHKSAGSTAPFDNPSILGQSPGDNLTFFTANHHSVFIPAAIAGKVTLVALSHIVQPYLKAGSLVRLNLNLDFNLSLVAVTTRASSYSPVISRLIRRARDIGQRLDVEWLATSDMLAAE